MGQWHVPTSGPGLAKSLQSDASWFHESGLLNCEHEAVLFWLTFFWNLSLSG